MQSKKNLVKKQEETPGAEEVTISLEEYSNMKKRLHELGGMGPSMQSPKREESPGVVPETPQSGGQTYLGTKESLIKNLAFDQKNFAAFKNILLLRLRKADINENDAKLDLFLSCLTMEQQEIWARMKENDRDDFQKVLEYFEGLYGRRNELSISEFVQSKQGREKATDFALKMQKKATRVRHIHEEQVINAIIAGLQPQLSVLLPSLHYRNVIELVQDIEKCESMMNERQRLWKQSFPEEARKTVTKQNAYSKEDFQKSLARRYGIAPSTVSQRLREQKCVRCGREGHVAKNCAVKAAKLDEIHDSQVENINEAVQQMEIGLSDSNFSNKSEILFSMNVNKRCATAKLDTGAMVTVIDQRLVARSLIQPASIAVKGVGGTNVHVLGEATVSLSIGKRFLPCVRVLVIPKLHGKDLLLGLSDYFKLGGTLGGSIWNSVELNVESVDAYTDESSEKQWINNAIRDHYRVNPNEQSKLGPFTIKLKEGQSFDDISSRPFKISQERQKMLDQKLGALVADGVLEEKAGATSSPVFLLKKPNGDYRLLCDFRKFNNCTESVATTVENMEDLLALAEGKNYFTTVDLSDGFFQVALTEESQGLTGIVTLNSRYQFKVLPQGAKQSPQLFHNAVRKLLKTIPHAVNYIDDILVCSETKEEPKKTLFCSLKCCRETT